MSFELVRLRWIWEAAFDGDFSLRRGGRSLRRRLKFFFPVSYQYLTVRSVLLLASFRVEHRDYHPARVPRDIHFSHFGDAGAKPLLHRCPQLSYIFERPFWPKLTYAMDWLIFVSAVRIGEKKIRDQPIMDSSSLGAEKFCKQQQSALVSETNLTGLSLILRFSDFTFLTVSYSNFCLDNLRRNVQ